jgi:hypothetical protein
MPECAAWLRASMDRIWSAPNRRGQRTSLALAADAPPVRQHVSAASRESTRRNEMAARWIFVIALALVLYGNGAAFVESFVNYSSWHLIGSAGGETRAA